MAWQQAIPDSGDGQIQMQGVIKERHEAVSLIERLGLLVDCIQLDRMNAQFLGQVETTAEGIKQRRVAEPMTLLSVIDRQAGQQNQEALEEMHSKP